MSINITLAWIELDCAVFYIPANTV